MRVRPNTLNHAASNAGSQSNSAKSPKKESKVQMTASSVMNDLSPSTATTQKRRLKTNKITSQVSLLKANNKILANGNRYVGQMQEGLPHGKGKEYDKKSKKLVFEGMYEAGQRIDASELKNLNSLSLIAILKRKNPSLTHNF